MFCSLMIFHTSALCVCVSACIHVPCFPECGVLKLMSLGTFGIGMCGYMHVGEFNGVCGCK